jgi:hypothetical protein
MTTDHFSQPTETRPTSDKGIKTEESVRSLSMERTNVMTMTRRNSETSSNKPELSIADCLLQDVLSQYSIMECAGAENIGVQIIHESMNVIDSVIRTAKSIS